MFSLATGCIRPVDLLGLDELGDAVSCKVELWDVVGVCQHLLLYLKVQWPPDQLLGYHLVRVDSFGLTVSADAFHYEVSDWPSKP